MAWSGTWATEYNAWPSDHADSLAYTQSTLQQLAATSINSKTMAAAVKELEIQNRERVICDYIQRTRMWKTEGERLPFDEVRVVSHQRLHDRYAEEIVLMDRLTGKYYQFSRDLRDNMHYTRVDKNAFRGMDYKVQLYDEMKYWRYGTGADRGQVKIEDPTCASCKTRHRAEKLDIIGRCSVKLKSHQEKLRKLYWAHKKKTK